MLIVLTCAITLDEQSSLMSTPNSKPARSACDADLNFPSFLVTLTRGFTRVDGSGFHCELPRRDWRNRQMTPATTLAGHEGRPLMHARSALFDVYGDHVRTRGGSAPVAALVNLLAPLGINAPAVRTAISRMVRQGWLIAADLDGQRGYTLTTRAMRRLDESAVRIYRTRHRTWDGKLDLVLFTPPAARRARTALATALRFHGYGPLSPGNWVSPWPVAELDTTFEEAGVEFDRFSSHHYGDTVALTRRAWDLDALANRYRNFVSDLEPIVNLVGAGTPDETAYTARCQLVHAFRVFLFSDPQLPAELCPPQWAGSAAAAFFDAQAARLRPAADRFVDHCMHAK